MPIASINPATGAVLERFEPLSEAEIEHRLDLAEISPLLTPDVLAVLTAQGSVESRDGRGGTATVQVERQLREMFDEIDKISEWCLETLAANDPVAQPDEEPQFEWRAERPGEGPHAEDSLRDT